MSFQEGPLKILAKELEAQRKELAKALLSWYRAVERPLPWRLLWKQRRDPYPVWVSEIMLQQTQIATVEPLYKVFMKRFPSLGSLAKAPEEALVPMVQGLGYYRRFRWLHQGAKELWERGSWPKSYLEWLQVPGVGPYTAAAISSISLGEPQAVLDGNVIRVLARLLGASVVPNGAGIPSFFQDLAQRLLAVEDPGAFNQALMELGQTLCRPQEALCASCPLAPFCRASRAQDPLAFPLPKSRAPVLELQLRLWVVASPCGAFLLERRDKGARFLRGHWGLPMEEGPLKEGRWPLLEDMGSFSHSITRHRLRVQVCCTELAGLPGGAQLAAPEEMAGKLISSLDRKAWNIFQART